MQNVAQSPAVITALEIAATLPGRPLLVVGEVAGAVPGCAVFERDAGAPRDRDAIARRLRTCVDRLAEYWREQGRDSDMAAVCWGAVLVDRTWRFRPVWSQPYAWLRSVDCSAIELLADGEARLSDLGLARIATQCGRAGAEIVEFARRANAFRVERALRSA